jgi:dCMP deaminase
METYSDDKKKRYKSMYMDIAERIAKMSHAKRLQVGSVLVKDDAIISYGWNGMPPGFDNDCEDVETFEQRYTHSTKPEVLHSEANCLAKVAKSTNSSKDSMLFVTHSPCMECAKLIHQSGVKSVYYKYLYRSDAGLEFLKKCNIEVMQT